MSTDISNGILQTPIINEVKYLVDNFTESGIIQSSEWAFGSNTFSNGIVSLTGTSPTIQSKVFTVGADDIIVFDFIVSLPTPSTTTSGPGLYLGTKYGQSVYVHGFNYTTKKWTQSSSTNTNPYFFYSYNSTIEMKIKSYVLGYNVSLNDVPLPENNINYSMNCIQLTGTDTSTYIRSGYNSNSSMVINFSNPKIYRLNAEQHESGDIIKTNNNYTHAIDFIEK